jgi:hypothetical protein
MRSCRLSARHMPAPSSSDSAAAVMYRSCVDGGQWVERRARPTRRPNARDPE